VLASLLLHRIRDPRVTPVTITRVVLSPDLRQARAYFTLLAMDSGGRSAAEEGLAHAAPFLRRHLAEELELRFTPTLEFHFDTQLEGARRVEALLRGLRRPEEE
jgi:ribosome-binding factor A